MAGSYHLEKLTLVDGVSVTVATAGQLGLDQAGRTLEKVVSCHSTCSVCHSSLFRRVLAPIDLSSFSVWSLLSMSAQTVKYIF